METTLFIPEEMIRFNLQRRIRKQSLQLRAPHTGEQGTGVQIQNRNLGYRQDEKVGRKNPQRTAHISKWVNK